MYFCLINYRLWMIRISSTLHLHVSKLRSNEFITIIYINILVFIFFFHFGNSSLHGYSYRRSHYKSNSHNAHTRGKNWWQSIWQLATLGLGKRNNHISNQSMTKVLDPSFFTSDLDLKNVYIANKVNTK